MRRLYLQIYLAFLGILLLFGVLFVQWVRSSMKEGAREDRRLDLLEARERAGERTRGKPTDRSTEPHR